MPAHTSPTLFPHPLALCCHYPVSKCRSASIVVTGTVRVKTESPKDRHNLDAMIHDDGSHVAQGGKN